MIHKAQNSYDFLKTVNMTMILSGMLNRFVTLGSTVQKRTLDKYDIFKVSIAQFMIGSDYVTRSENRDPNFKVKRDSYYQNYNDNGSLKQLIKEPSKIYVCVWKFQMKNIVEVYLNENGSIIDPKNVHLRPSSPNAPRYYHIENIWYLKANGQEILGEEFDTYKDYLVSANLMAEDRI